MRRAQFTTPSVAYFSMEIGLRTEIPTYSGGLGVLAGDTLRSAADLGVNAVAVTLIYHKGYFTQQLEKGAQTEKPVAWVPREWLTPLPNRVAVEIAGRKVMLGAWRLEIRGHKGHVVPVIYLDARQPENHADDQSLTDHLYGGDDTYRLSQEIILGIGGVRMLRSLGYSAIDKFHMNEGHASLLTLELIEEGLGRQEPVLAHCAAQVERIKGSCVFTTHTPVPAGHDRFDAALAKKLVQPRLWSIAQACGQLERLDTTGLALHCSGYVNGVAMKHGEVSRDMFPGHAIHAITNGIDAGYWSTPPFQRLFDRWIPDWRDDHEFLRHAYAIPLDDIWQAHLEVKRELCQIINRNRSSDDFFAVNAFTIGFARRATAYKRAMLIFKDSGRLYRLAQKFGPLQIVMAGKAHPKDQAGKSIIAEILKIEKELKGDVRVAFLENYNMTLGHWITTGVDVWLNNPRPPLEASGTSGMKSALNGVPSLSILDGWWIEGHLEGQTGWAIDQTPVAPSVDEHTMDELHAEALYQKLESAVLPTFVDQPAQWREIMRHAIAVNGSYFNTQRMVGQYLRNAWA